MTDAVFSIKTPEIQAEIDELQGAMWDLESGGHHDGIKKAIPYIQLRAGISAQGCPTLPLPNFF